MARLSIRMFGDPVLRQRAAEVPEVTDIQRRLIQDMLQTMREAPGVGLAAPQVGMLQRIFVYEVQGEGGALVNPHIVARSEELEEGEEGCLSMPGLSYPVMRSTSCVVEALDEEGEQIVLEVEGYLARIFQHEIDHLDGVLFIDHLPKRLRRQAMRELTDMALGVGIGSSAAGGGTTL